MGPSEDIHPHLFHALGSLHTTLLRFKRYPSHCILATPLRPELAMPQTASALECNHVTRSRDDMLVPDTKLLVT